MHRSAREATQSFFSASATAKAPHRATTSFLMARSVRTEARGSTLRENVPAYPPSGAETYPHAFRRRKRAAETCGGVCTKGRRGMKMRRGGRRECLSSSCRGPKIRDADFFPGSAGHEKRTESVPNGLWTSPVAFAKASSRGRDKTSDVPCSYSQPGTRTARKAENGARARRIASQEGRKP